MIRLPILAAVTCFLVDPALAIEIKRDDASRPIIAQMLHDPTLYLSKPVTIYGLVIERLGRSSFVLQDVSQRPLKVVGGPRVRAATGDQVTVYGVLVRDRNDYYFAARSLIPTRVLGGGGCC